MALFRTDRFWAAEPCLMTVAAFAAQAAQLRIRGATLKNFGLIRFGFGARSELWQLRMTGFCHAIEIDVLPWRTRHAAHTCIVTEQEWRG